MSTDWTVNGFHADPAICKLIQQKGRGGGLTFAFGKDSSIHNSFKLYISTSHLCLSLDPDILPFVVLLPKPVTCPVNCELIPYSQRAHLNISLSSITGGSQWANTVLSQGTNSHWAHCYLCIVGLSGILSAGPTPGYTCWPSGPPTSWRKTFFWVLWLI